jgi:hypothetical protein
VGMRELARWYRRCCLRPWFWFRTYFFGRFAAMAYEVGGERWDGDGDYPVPGDVTCSNPHVRPGRRPPGRAAALPALS